MQRLAGYELEDEEARSTGVLEAVDRGDVRMVERGESPRLALQPREPVGVRRELRREDLDRDLAAEPRVMRPIDLAHPARAQGREDLVRAEPRAGFQGHPGGDYRPLMAPPTPVVEGPDAEEYRSDSSSTWTND